MFGYDINRKESAHEWNGFFRVVCDLFFEGLRLLLLKVQSAPESLDLDPKAGHNLSINCQLLHELQNIENREVTQMSKS